MIISENLPNNLIRHYSDAGLKIRQIETGAVYDETVDVVPCRYTYSETNEPIIEPEPPEDDRDPQEIIAELWATIRQQEIEIADMDEYIIDIMYESILEDLLA